MKSYEGRFAENLARLRRKKGLSQRQLGEALGFSDKTVSKWERAGGIPHVQVLYRLAELFGVGIDEFFLNDGGYLLGIDGGGTKTTYLLADEGLNILRQVRGDGCNPMDIGIEGAKERLRCGIGEICQGIPLSKTVVFAGIAGGTSADHQAALTDFFRGFGFAAFENDNDNRNIIAAGLGHGNGITAILGTGICVFSQKDGVRRRFSGWGYLFDEGGSAYNIGRDGLSACFEAYDGYGVPTAMLDELLGTHNDPRTLLGELYDGGKKEIAAYAHMVYRHAKEGDGVADNILRRNMRTAAKVIETAAVELAEEKIPVVLAGGLTSEDLTLRYLREALGENPRFDLQILSFAPVHGALILAKELSEARKKGEMI